MQVVTSWWRDKQTNKQKTFKMATFQKVKSKIDMQAKCNEVSLLSSWQIAENILFW